MLLCALCGTFWSGLCGVAQCSVNFNPTNALFHALAVFYSGFLVLPWMWVVTVWLYWGEFIHGRDPVVKKCESAPVIMMRSCLGPGRKVRVRVSALSHPNSFDGFCSNPPVQSCPCNRRDSILMLQLGDACCPTACITSWTSISGT